MDTGRIVQLVCMLLPAVCALVSFIYGIFKFFKKGKPLCLQCVALAMGCYALSGIYEACHFLIFNGTHGSFSPAYFGYLGFFLFFVTASFGQLDRIVDDGSPSTKKSRIIAILAPVLSLALFVPVIFAPHLTVFVKIIYLLIWSSGAFALYYQLKHAIIPDMDFGFIKAIKPYNIVSICLGVSFFLYLLAWAYLNNIFLIISSLLFSTFCVLTSIFAERGVRKWTI